MVYINRDRIRFTDTDATGIVYFGSFATYFDESFLAMIRESNIGWDEHKKYNFGLPIVDYKVQYFHPLKFGDEIDVYCIIIHIGNSSFTSLHLISSAKSGRIYSKAEITRVSVSLKGFKKIPIPEFLLEIFKANYDKIDDKGIKTLEKRIASWKSDSS